MRACRPLSDAGQPLHCSTRQPRHASTRNRETIALQRVFGLQTTELPVSSVKARWDTGLPGPARLVFRVRIALPHGDACCRPPGWSIRIQPVRCSTSWVGRRTCALRWWLNLALALVSQPQCKMARRSIGGTPSLWQGPACLKHGSASPTWPPRRREPLPAASAWSALREIDPRS